MRHIRVLTHCNTHLLSDEARRARDHNLGAIAFLSGQLTSNQLKGKTEGDL